MVRLFTFYAIFVALFGLAMRLDPFYIVINWTLSNIQGDINRVIFYFCANLVRIYVSVVCTVETCRHMCLIFIMFANTLQTGKIMSKGTIATGILHSDMRISSARKNMLSLSCLINEDHQSRLCMFLMSKFQESSTLVVFGLGLFAGIIFNTGSIKLWNILPFWLYFYFPSVSGIIVLIISILLPQAQVINDYSVMVLHKWNVEIMMEPDIKERNILRKKLKSLKPKKLHVGIHEVRFFSIDRSTKAEFYVRILDNTINLSLAIPEESLRSQFGAF